MQTEETIVLLYGLQRGVERRPQFERRLASGEVADTGANSRCSKQPRALGLEHRQPRHLVDGLRDRLVKALPGIDRGQASRLGGDWQHQFDELARGLLRVPVVQVGQRQRI